MEFQIYDYVEDHIMPDLETDSENDSHTKQKYTNPDYIIHVFGRTFEGKSVYCQLTEYTPHFYIKLPISWAKKEAKNKIKIMEKWLKSDANKKVWRKFRKGLLKMELVERKDAIGFTNDKNYYFARLVFNNTSVMSKFKYYLEQNKVNIPRVTTKWVQFKTYESNLPSLLRCFHIKKISGCSWVKIDKYKEVDKYDKISYCDIEIKTKWTNINPIEKSKNAPFIIASFDIECNSIDGQFPQARRSGDKIIQIGTTYTRLGESEPFRQHIVCLDKTDKVDNCETEWYKDERDLILAWKNEILKSGCDFLTGYNTFFFDEKYVYDRCCLHLNLQYDIIKLSKLKEFDCKFREFKLSSSALGENQLRTFSTPGVVHFDLMKEVQKTYKLSSYKLDSVSSNFIRGEINNVKKNKKYYILECQTVEDICDNDYIHIEHVKNFVSDNIGNKFLITKVNREKKTLKIKSDIEISNVSEGKLFWSQAKDDVGPKEIFSLQKGTPKDRCKVAKYCVKDCRLVGLLVNKLEIVTKSIEMANVSFVPMSYLFTRGQGIKLFSVVLKEFKEAGYLFPVIKKTDKDTKYEGAIVFDPIPDVYYEPLVTKDYASLYPSSLMHKNMSHETLVKNSDYDNLDGVKYYNANYKQEDGTIKYVRFAQKNNELGVIPATLNKILKERKLVKKEMKIEKDPFKYKILDAKQLALKLTANSLYGQLGAPVSPLYCLPIAACTTSTGREMLIFAKKYDEEILSGFINGLKYAYKKNNMDIVEKLYQSELKDPSDENLKEKIKNFITKDMDGLCFQPIIRYGDTDSVFTGFRFMSNLKKKGKKSSLDLWKEIMTFGKKLISYFLQPDDKEIWERLYDKYYGEDKIKSLKVPKGPDCMPKPDHWNILLPIEERMKQFLKEYVEESYLPWLWNLQDFFLNYKEKMLNLDKSRPKADSFYDKLIQVKLINWGHYQVEKMRLSPYDYLFENTELKDKIKEQKQNMEMEIEDFCKYLGKIIIEPYWSFNKNNKIIKVKLWNSGKIITSKQSLNLAIDMGIISGETVKSYLPYPHDLEYEKTFWPFLILTKKRYVGNKYEFDKEKFKQDFMGIVLKRRDNAPIVKEICNGIIDSLINYQDPKMAREFTQQSLLDMFNDKFDIKYFLVSKTLKMKESYKDWTKMAHVVLAERIGIRDPGNRPQSGDRITFATVKIPNKTKDTLQGDMIETPEYIKENNIKLDYNFYVSNQIMKPALQFLELAVDNPKEIFDVYTKMEKIYELISDRNLLVNSLKNMNDNDFEEFNPYLKNLSLEEKDNVIEDIKKDKRKLQSRLRKKLKENK